MYLTLQSRFLEPFFGRFNFLDGVRESGAWAPAVDVAEETDKIVVKVEVPGMNENDLKVSFENGVLTVSGERPYGSFVRSFSLPRSVDANRIAANYVNGVLEIEIPKLEEAKPKQIQISVGTQKQINA